MEIHNYLWLLAFINFAYIYLKAGQQLNVVNFEVKRIPLFTFGMATCEVILWGSVSVSYMEDGLSGAVASILYITVGGTAGCWYAMYHNYKRGKYDHLHKA